MVRELVFEGSDHFFVESSAELMDIFLRSKTSTEENQTS